MPAAANLLLRAVDLLAEQDPVATRAGPGSGRGTDGDVSLRGGRRSPAPALEGPPRELGDRRLGGQDPAAAAEPRLVGGETDEAPAVAEAEQILATLRELGDHGGAARAWRVLS